MVETLIKALIALCLIVGCVFLVLWVVASLGVAIPAMVIKIIWIIVVLIAILFLWRVLKASGLGLGSL